MNLIFKHLKRQGESAKNIRTIEILFEKLLERQPSIKDLEEYSNRPLNEVIEAITISPEYSLKRSNYRVPLTKILDEISLFYKWFPLIESLEFESKEIKDLRIDFLDKFASMTSYKQNSFCYTENLLCLIKSPKTNTFRGYVSTCRREELQELKYLYTNFMHFFGMYSLKLYAYNNKEKSFYSIYKFFYDYRNEYQFDFDFKEKMFLVVFE